MFRLQAMEKNTKPDHKHAEPEIERDHLGQGVNPAIELEKKNMEEAAKRGEQAAKDAEKAEKSKAA
jgi:hypothetical protein